MGRHPGQPEQLGGAAVRYLGLSEWHRRQWWLGDQPRQHFQQYQHRVDVNDAGDPDSGPNGFQNYPVVSAAAASATQTLVAWSLNSTASTTFSLEFFSSPTCSARGNGEGQTYLGSAIVSPSTVGHVLTATAINSGTRNTSEFSACRVITVAPPAAGTPPFMDSIPNQNGTVGAPFSFALAPFVTLTESDPILSYAVLGSMTPGLVLDTTPFPSSLLRASNCPAQKLNSN